MYKLLTIVFIFICSNVFGRAFYVSNAGNNSNNGLTTATSWLTLAQVNVTTLTTGDSVLFKCGDTFYGSLTGIASGVTFASYGTGAKPIITGFVSIASWTNLGSNIYEAVVPNGLSTVNMVISNGVTIPMGRFPNANTANGGYLTYEAKDTVAKTITDNQLTNSPNWTGADIVIRKQDYALVRNQVVNHATTVLTLNTRGSFDFRLGGYGYFFENSLSTLDQNGEWFYDSTTHKIKMYYTSTPPTIQVGTISTLINFPIANVSNVTIKNLSLQGSESDLLYISYCQNVTIDSCNFSFAGGSAIQNRNMNNFLVQNCTFSDINMLGIHEVNAGADTTVTIKKNNFKRIGIYPGMIVKNNPNYAEGASNTAMSFGCLNLTIRENTIDSVGYCGVLLSKNKDNQIIRQNIISNYCSLKNDGGAIYNSGIRSDAMISVPVIIDSNIISLSNDASNGTASPSEPHCRGIYLDASSSKVNVYNNTIYSSYEGMYISQAQYINVKYNTIYGAGKYIAGGAVGTNRYAASLNIFDGNDGYQHTRFNNITNNTFFSDQPNQLFIFQTDRYKGVDSVGIIDSNYYVSPMDDYPLYLTNLDSNSIISTFSFKMWRQGHSVYDAHSSFSSVVIAPFARTFTSANKSVNSGFTGDVSNTTASSTNSAHTFSWDNTSQITGTGSAKLVNSTTSSVMTQVMQVIGAIDATKKYVLRFKTKATKLGNFETYFQEWTGSYNIMTATKQVGSIDTALQQHELLITGQTSISNGAIYINFSQNSQTIYIDDIELYEATATNNVMTDFVKFTVNPSSAPLMVGLGGNSYNTLANSSLNTVYTVPAYSSSILFKGGVFIAPVYLNPIKLPFKFKRG